jgi:hypothetical protein
MKKTGLFVAVSCLVSLLLLSICHAKSLQLIIEDFSRADNGYMIRFSVRNNYTYDRNPIVAFKILDGDTPLACKQIALKVAKGADGSKVHETKIDAPPREGVILESRIFERVRRNRVGGWFADCP